MRTATTRAATTRAATTRAATTCAALVLAAGLAAGGCAVAVPGAASPDSAVVSDSNPMPAPRPEGRLFQDAQGRFGLVPPEGWTVDTSGAQNTAVIFADPQPSESASGRFRANINVIVLPAAGDLGGTVVKARQELTWLPGYQPTSDEPVTLPDGSRAHLLGGTFGDPGTGLPLRNVQVLTVHDGETVVVTGTALAETWAGYEAVFSASLRSLTVAT
jgi:hypothetical protein